MCQQRPSRRASSWTHLAFAGGDVASTSDAPDIGLFFYPSFHFDIPPRASRHIHLAHRALRRSLAYSRTLLPSASAFARHTIFSEVKQPPRRHASHRSASSSSSQKQKDRQKKDNAAPGESSLPANAPWIAETHTQSAKASAAVFQGGKHDEYPTSGLRIRQPNEGELPLNAAEEEAFHFWNKMQTRVWEAINRHAAPRQIRFRLYGLLRLIPRFFLAERKQIDRLNSTISRIVDIHCKTNDVRSIETIVHRAELISEQYPNFKQQRRNYDRLLRAYTRALRSKDACGVLDKLQDLGFKPTAENYLNFITMYAHMKDPENARRVVELMEREGITADQKALSSLMNAYVEAGFWDDAVQIFEYLDSHPKGHPLRPDLFTCTTLMKCYVLMGAPIDEIMKVFNGMQARGLEPSKKTYALALHAACEAGNFEDAEEIFARLDEADDESLKPGVFAFTIMVRGLLRAGKRDDAFEYYREMEKRGIRPTAATWSVMLQTYAQVGRSETTAILADLLQQYLETYLDLPSNRVRPQPYHEDKTVARGTALDSVFGPVITALAKGVGQHAPPQEEAEESDASSNSSEVAVVKLYQQMQSYPGSRPSLHLYTVLLDACRRVGDTAGVQALWPHIVEFAAKKADPKPISLLQEEQETSKVAPSMRNLLCLPLSIYIDAMSSHHLHQKVAEAWESIQRLGFGFDVGNWNHLVVALLRAGETRRGFWVAEELLRDALQYSSAEQKRLQWETEADVADFEPRLAAEVNPVEDGDQPNLVEEDKADTPMRPPNRASQFYRERKDYLYGQQEPLVLPESLGGSGVPLKDADLASSLTASYNELREQRGALVWKLFPATVDLLSAAFSRVEQEEAEKRYNPRDEWDTVTEGDGELQHYKTEYPLTMIKIKQYRNKMHRLGMRDYA